MAKERSVQSFISDPILRMSGGGRLFRRLQLAIVQTSANTTNAERKPAFIDPKTGIRLGTRMPLRTVVGQRNGAFGSFVSSSLTPFGFANITSPPNIAVSFRNIVNIFTLQKMAAFTVRLTSILGRDAAAPKIIFSRCYWFNMRRVRTPSNSAQMIALQRFGDRAHEQRIHEPVGKQRTLTIYIERAIAFFCAIAPQPASGQRINGDVRKKFGKQSPRDGELAIIVPSHVAKANSFSDVIRVVNGMNHRSRPAFIVS